ncbi:nucleoside hydrolase [Acidaminobacter hydrogenoformans]|uniref:Purine nucleosidase n=1 Tax=Acidaminobacter hydrogenoformans DSM 2784 TaxID=1120920 RepID=A0A1G5RTT5_9FIRM|nr:nucleoside hydrolase [Acidaminobacter hydrogenoformans]SCZ77120.1 purine nucleosidase [Acidaminobacter hydrogenoformans DSM 2784]
MTVAGFIRKKKVILDVDTGIDDAIAIMLALASPELEVIGITTVSGNIDLESATKNTLKVLKLIGREALPVFKGALKPLWRSIRYAKEVHGDCGLAGQLAELQPGEPSEVDAGTFIKSQLEQYPGEITLIMTGPETNLGVLLMQDRDLALKFKEIIVMGGVAEGRGNESPVAEFNIAIDPEAADLVFHSGAPLTMVGLDVTRKALLRKTDIDALTASPDIKKFVDQVTMEYRQRFLAINGFEACLMHDPLAVAVAIDPSLVKCIHRYVGIETESRYCDGQTVCDFDGRWGKSPNAQVCIGLDAERFIELLTTRLNRY